MQHLSQKNFRVSCFPR